MALTGEETIYNLALGYVGEYRVEEGATTTKQYILCDRFYDQARDEVLKSHPWNEAKKRIIIAQDSDNPIFGYDRRYSKPTDCLRVLSVNDSIGADQRNNADGVNAWEIEGDYILANAGELPQTWATATAYIDGQFVWSDDISYEVLVSHTSDTIANDVTAGNLVSAGGDYRVVFVEYVYQLTDTTKFGSKLKQVIAMKLAIKIITGLTNDTKGKVDLINEFERLTMPKARSIDGAQMTPKPIFNSNWLRSRTTGARNIW
jgi:hypothetical protein